MEIETRRHRMPKVLGALVLASAMALSVAPVAHADEVDLTPGPTVVADDARRMVVANFPLRAATER